MNTPSSRRAGRPKSHEKRTAILNAAGDAFLEQGFDATSVEAIAARAGVSKQTVYSHFETKEALLHAVVGNKVAAYEFADASTLWRRPPREGLGELARGHLELLLDPEVVAMHRVVIAECQRSPGLAQAFWASGPERTVGRVADCIEHWAEAGALALDPGLAAPVAARHAASQFLALLGGEYRWGAVLNVVDTVDRDELDAHVDRTVEAFLKLYGSSA